MSGTLPTKESPERRKSDANEAPPARRPSITAGDTSKTSDGGSSRARRSSITKFHVAAGRLSAIKPLAVTDHVARCFKKDPERRDEEVIKNAMHELKQRGSIFSSMLQGYLHEMVSRGTCLFLKPGDILIHAGDKADHFFAIVHGSLNLYPPERPSEQPITEVAERPKSPITSMLEARPESPARALSEREAKAAALRSKIVSGGSAKKKLDEFQQSIKMAKYAESGIQMHGERSWSGTAASPIAPRSPGSLGLVSSIQAVDQDSEPASSSGGPSRVQGAPPASDDPLAKFGIPSGHIEVGAGYSDIHVALGGEYPCTVVAKTHVAVMVVSEADYARWFSQRLANVHHAHFMCTQVPFFRGARLDDMVKTVSHATHKQLAPRSLVIRSKTLSQKVWVIMSGSCKIVRDVPADVALAARKRVEGLTKAAVQTGEMRSDLDLMFELKKGMVKSGGGGGPTAEVEVAGLKVGDMFGLGNLLFRRPEEDNIYVGDIGSAHVIGISCDEMNKRFGGHPDWVNKWGTLRSSYESSLEHRKKQEGIASRVKKMVLCQRIVGTFMEKEVPVNRSWTGTRGWGMRVSKSSGGTAIRRPWTAESDEHGAEGRQRPALVGAAAPGGVVGGSTGPARGQQVTRRWGGWRLGDDGPSLVDGTPWKAAKKAGVVTDKSLEVPDRRSYLREYSSKGKGLGKQYVGEEPKAKIAVVRSRKIDPEVTEVFARRLDVPDETIIEAGDVGYREPEIEMTRGHSDRDDVVYNKIRSALAKFDEFVVAGGTVQNLDWGGKHSSPSASPELSAASPSVRPRASKLSSPHLHTGSADGSDESSPNRDRSPSTVPSPEARSSRGSPKMAVSPALRPKSGEAHSPGSKVSSWLVAEKAGRSEFKRLRSGGSVRPTSALSVSASAVSGRSGTERRSETLDMKEWLMLLRSCHLVFDKKRDVGTDFCVTLTDATNVFKTVDINRSNQLDYHEFVKALMEVCYVLRMPPPPELIVLSDEVTRVRSGGCIDDEEEDEYGGFVELLHRGEFGDANVLSLDTDDDVDDHLHGRGAEDYDHVEDAPRPRKAKWQSPFMQIQHDRKMERLYKGLAPRSPLRPNTPQESQRRGSAPLSPLICKSPNPARPVSRTASLAHENSNVSLSSQKSRGEKRDPKTLRGDSRPVSSLDSALEGGSFAGLQRPVTSGVATSGQGLRNLNTPPFTTLVAGYSSSMARPSTRG